jgi:hypothetical protein
MRKLGFTGTRNQLTMQQRTWLVEFVKETQPEEAAHGDCIGADEEFHSILRAYARSCRIEIWPSIHPTMRAYCDGDIIHESLPSLERDQLIVDFATEFVGCPPTNKEITRSGSWATLRKARKKYRRNELDALYVVYPDGYIAHGDNWIRTVPDV